MLSFGRYLYCAALVVLVAPWVAGRAHGAVATFENFDEGDFFFPSFIDPLSGIFFSESTGPDPGSWFIEFAGPFPTLPTISPGSYLSSSGYSPGPGFGLPFEFGITGILPTLADEVFMTVAYATDPGATIVLEGFDASGNVVATSTFFPPDGTFLELQIGIHSSSVNIHSFKVTPTDIFIGYDNITFVPEPVSVLVVLGLGLSARRRRDGTCITGFQTTRAA